MMEGTTHRLLWTLAVFLIGSLIIFGAKFFFPDAAERSMDTIQQAIDNQSKSSTSSSSNSTTDDPTKSPTVINPDIPNNVPWETDDSLTDNTSDYWYYYDPSTMTCVIHGYHGNGGDVIVPAYRKLTEACNGAPAGTYKVTSLNGPVFNQSTSITSVSFTDQIKDFNSSNANMFAGRTLNKVVLPDTVTNIPATMFSGTTITSVYLPNSITSIGASAFCQVKGMDTIVLPNNLDSIGSNAFQASSLKYITFPDHLTEIPENGFYQSVSLAKVVLPAGLKTIDSGAFQACSSLKDVKFDRCSVAYTIGASAFYGDAIETLDFRDTPLTEIGQSAFHTDPVSSVEFNSDLQKLDSSTFYGNSLSQVTVPENTSLGYNDFGGNTKTLVVNLPAKDKSLWFPNIAGGGVTASATYY